MPVPDNNLADADFSMPLIKNLSLHSTLENVSMNLDRNDPEAQWRPPVKSEFNSPLTPSYCEDDSKAQSSRLQDEKISDDSGAEAKTNSALAPAGLKNPFWSRAS
jgi:hypothetical protein